jgi:peptide/nickel transport system ATP-binding protein
VKYEDVGYEYAEPLDTQATAAFGGGLIETDEEERGEADD